MEHISKPAIPFASSWSRCSKCRLRQNGDDWYIHFSGDLETYTPNMATLKAARNIRLSDNAQDKPSDDALKFFEMYGPLGLFYTNIVSASWDVDAGQTVTVKRPSGSYALDADTGDEEMTLEEYWLRYHNRKLPPAPKKTPWMPPSTTEVFTNYHEPWSRLHFYLTGLQSVFNTWAETEDTRIVNRVIEDKLEPHLVRQDDGIVWEFRFSTLRDALFGLMAQSIVRDDSWWQCMNKLCGRYYTGRQRTYCNAECRLRVNNRKRKTAFGREHHRLYERLKRRHKNDKIDRQLYELIYSEMSNAKSIEDLKAVEKKNDKLPRRLNTGPIIDGGSREYRE